MLLLGMKLRRRRVYINPLNRRRGKLWAYGYEDLARLFNLSVDRIRHLTTGKNRAFDPGDLQSIITYYLSRQD